MKLIHRISSYNRDRKWRLFMDRLRPTADMKVLDVGYSEQETLPTANYIEKHYPWPDQLTALGVDDPDKFHRFHPHVKAVQYDGTTFLLEDHSFDIIWSNAVLEHVGDINRQLHFIREMKRVGKRLFFSTPNRGFPIEIHTRMPFVHWLPKATCDRILKWAGKSSATGDYMHLLYKSDIRQLLRAAGLSNSEIVANRFFGFTMDFVVICQEHPIP